jgi:hypothetical protein
MHQAGPVGTPLAGCSTPRASRPVASRRMPAAQGFKANCTSGARWALCLEKRRHSLNSGVRANAAIRFKHRSLSRPSRATRGFYPPVSKDTVNAGDKTYQDCLTSCSAAAVFGYRRHRRWAKVTNTVPGLALAVGARSSQSRPQASQAPAPDRLYRCIRWARATQDPDCQAARGAGHFVKPRSSSMSEANRAAAHAR